MSDARLPPYDLRAERKLSGAVFRDPRFLDIATVREDEFRDYLCANIFAAVRNIVEGGGIADDITVPNELRRRGITDITLDDLGSLIAEAPSAPDIAALCDIIRRDAIARRLLQFASVCLGDGNDRSLSGDELLARAEQGLLDVGNLSTRGGAQHISDTIRETWRALDERRSRADQFTGLPSGFAGLDTLTAGFQAGDLVVVAARPSAGKTAIASNIALHAAVEERVPVLFASIEQRRTELTERLLCTLAMVDGNRLRNGRLRQAEQERLFRAGELLTRTSLQIDDTPSQDLIHISATARRLKRQSGIRMLVVDYLQLISVPATRETRQEQVASLSRRLKLLARELQIPVIVLAQLNREVEARQGGRPKLSDLRESGAIEQDADVVILLHRQDDGLVDLILAKQRNGPIGDVRLAYVKQHLRFTEITE